MIAGTLVGSQEMTKTQHKRAEDMDNFRRIQRGPNPIRCHNPHCSPSGEKPAKLRWANRKKKYCERCSKSASSLIHKTVVSVEQAREYNAHFEHKSKYLIGLRGAIPTRSTGGNPRYEPAMALIKNKVGLELGYDAFRDMACRRTKATPERIAKIAEAFNVSEERLIWGEE